MVHYITAHFQQLASSLIRPVSIHHAASKVIMRDSVMTTHIIPTHRIYLFILYKKQVQ